MMVMPVNVEFQGDEKEVAYMRFCTLSNKFLETILCGEQTDEMSPINVELIARPYISNGKKVVLENRSGKFKEAINGDFVIALSPKHGNICIRGLPDGICLCKSDYDISTLFAYGIRQGYSPECTSVAIQMFYKPTG